MDRKTAHEVFAGLEEFTRVDENPGSDDDGQPLEAEQLPVYAVRFDAPVNGYDEREYRIRVSPGAASNWHGREDWADVLRLAEEHELGVKVDNGAMELT
jgi:hypothetical protein